MPFVHVAWAEVLGGSEFPTIEATATYDGPGAEASSFAVTLPSGIQSGDLLVVFTASSSEYNANTNTPSGWTALYTGNYGTGNTVAACFYREATGSEGSTVTVTTSISTRLAATAYRISGWDDSGTVADAIEVSSAATGTSQAPDPASLTPSWGSLKTLWLAAAHSSAGSGIAYPASYTSGISGYTANSTTWHARASTAERELEATSENPGAFSLAPSASQPWHARTVAVKGGAASGGGGWTYEVFTSGGTWDWSAAGSPSTVDVLVLAGGGGGGGDGGGGGGGAGGLVIAEDVSVSADVTVTVGAGGAGGSEQGVKGSDSSFGATTAEGGGKGGGGWTAEDIRSLGGDGGSGGGAGRSGTGNTYNYGGTATTGQGSDGGDSLSTNDAAGGGGGKGAAGGNRSYSAPDTFAGDGGDGVTLTSLGWGDAVTEGAPSAVAGGGGGGTSGGTDRYAGYGGYGGGGDGGPDASSNTSGIGSSGTANTGGGGGGGHSQDGSMYAGGSGGSGLVIVRYGGS